MDRFKKKASQGETSWSSSNSSRTGEKLSADRGSEIMEPFFFLRRACISGKIAVSSEDIDDKK